MPSHVEANLIKILSLLIPASLYMAISLWALAIDAAVSNDNRASTSVEIRPGTIFKISKPINTESLSAASLTCCSALSDCVFAQVTESFTKPW